MHHKLNLKWMKEQVDKLITRKRKQMLHTSQNKLTCRMPY